MTAKRDHISKADAVTVAAIQAGAPSLVEAHALIDQFHAMIRTKEADQLDPWLAEAKPSLISSFATGIATDKSAVRAAITEPWPNGQVEAQITKLELVKRQMYGRANLDLLQARLLGVHEARKSSSRLRQSRHAEPFHTLDVWSSLSPAAVGPHPLLRMFAHPPFEKAVDPARRFSDIGVTISGIGHVEGLGFDPEMNSSRPNNAGGNQLGIVGSGEHSRKGGRRRHVLEEWHEEAAGTL